MNPVIELATQQGVGLVVALLVPLLLVGVGAGLLGGWLASALGLRDSAWVQLLRALAVLFALSLLLESMLVGTRDYALEWWGALAEVHAEEPR